MQADSTRQPEFMQLVVAFIGLVAATSSLEGIWYLGVAEHIYQSKIGLLMNAQFDVFVAVLFYLFYSLGAIIFALYPALRAASWPLAMRAGGLYGFFCFSAHNLTDLADVKGFSWEITVIDIAWGTAMTAVACLLGYRLARCVRRQPAIELPTAQPR